jgi:hypothetical protein
MIPSGMILLLQVAAFSGAAVGLPSLSDGVRVVDLRCEYLADPLGIDVPQPRLSWKLGSPWRGQKQTACQVLVASDARMLKEDRADLVYGMATKTDYPSWGRWLEQGATTLWEQWDGGASRNHIMLGHLSAWFYETLAGINFDPETVGFQHVIIKPQLLGDIRWVRAEHKSMYGAIKSAWEIQGDTFTMKIAVPVNTTATVYVPGVKRESVTEGPDRIQTADCVRFLRIEGDYVVYEVESGTYESIAQRPAREAK